MIEDPKLAALIWASWREVNAVRAMTGVPCDWHGHPVGIQEEYWSALCDDLADALGDECQPWPSERMKPHVPRAKANGE